MAILKDKSKKKKGENIIGKIIYGFLLFMPLIAVGVACFYVMFNKNAYQSYSNYVEMQSKQLANGESMYEGTIYNVTYAKYGTNTNYRYQVESNNTDLHKYYSQQYEETIIAEFKIIHIAGHSDLVCYDNLGNEMPRIEHWYTKEGTFYFQNAQLNDTNTAYSTYDYIVTTTTAVSGTLDNVFYFQLQKLEDSDLFNWTKNTGAYTVMHNVTTGIGITNTYTPMLMTYWLLISVIYFIFDIALILVWAVHDKIHELKDAI